MVNDENGKANNLSSIVILIENRMLEVVRKIAGSAYRYRLRDFQRF